MRNFGYNTYANWERARNKAEEDAAYQEMIEEERGEKAYELYSSLPEEPEGVLSPKMMEIFSPLIDQNSDALEYLNDLLYDLCLLEIKRREAA
ncbi:hypothetical protein [Xenorhabdus sp. KJ12.1]|uniref:hypothetical protein n=1 Tax=Xenorhabdus sp. KJ12.1 TaxID=1851571 RepID=UPI000C03C904|nr:hypothetical protein [Xenorhabdus sp. KJ12.1]PHM70374.1 hypothetical protein Xekj_02002 [Xenorhabdus sp. KJ12.1]